MVGSMLAVTPKEGAVPVEDDVGCLLSCFKPTTELRTFTGPLLPYSIILEAFLGRTGNKPLNRIADRQCLCKFGAS